MGATPSTTFRRLHHFRAARIRRAHGPASTVLPWRAWRTQPVRARAQDVGGRVSAWRTPRTARWRARLPRRTVVRRAAGLRAPPRQRVSAGLCTGPGGAERCDVRRQLDRQRDEGVRRRLLQTPRENRHRRKCQQLDPVEQGQPRSGPLRQPGPCLSASAAKAGAMSIIPAMSSPTPSQSAATRSWSAAQSSSK